VTEHAPFIVAAYAIVWGALAAYVLTLRVRR
jgi:CcmD family protein